MKQSFKSFSLFHCINLVRLILIISSSFDKANSFQTNTAGDKRRFGRVATLASSKSTNYNYFAYGSNMALATMTDLRNLKPLSYTPAILPGYNLVFNVPGIPFVEPSFASAEPVKSTMYERNESLIHGILYTITEEDFIRVCQTEGVPLSYRLQRCDPIPYKGNSLRAGKNALFKYRNQTISAATREKGFDIDTDENDRKLVKTCPAFTLRARPLFGSKALPNIPPSQAYKNVLIRGAKEFDLDADYVQYLESIEVAPSTPFFGKGLAENWLQDAERRKSF